MTMVKVGKYYVHKDVIRDNDKKACLLKAIEKKKNGSVLFQYNVDNKANTIVLSKNDLKETLEVTPKKELEKGDYVIYAVNEQIVPLFSYGVVKDVKETKQDPIYGIQFQTSFYGANSLNGLLSSDTGLYIKRKMLYVVVKPKIKKTELSCKCCGKIFESTDIFKMTPINNKFCICKGCEKVKTYSEMNNVTINKKTKTGFTYGFELECVPFTPVAKILDKCPNLLPTKDSSLPDGGIEFKTPTYNGMRNVRGMLENMFAMCDFSDDLCGTHLNIGHVDRLKRAQVKRLATNKHDIFKPLEAMMLSDKEATVRVCGRNFNSYANTLDKSRDSHSDWVNTEHDNRIEFRISKLVTVNQYLELAHMWTEILDAVLAYLFDENGEPTENFNKKYYRPLHIKMLRIYKRYVDGKAYIQKVNRNKSTK